MLINQTYTYAGNIHLNSNLTPPCCLLQEKWMSSVCVFTVLISRLNILWLVSMRVILTLMKVHAQTSQSQQSWALQSVPSTDFPAWYLCGWLSFHGNKTWLWTSGACAKTKTYYMMSKFNITENKNEDITIAKQVHKLPSNPYFCGL